MQPQLLPAGGGGVKETIQNVERPGHRDWCSWVSAGRQAPEGEAVALGNLGTLRTLRNPTRRPPNPRVPLDDDLAHRMPIAAFDLDADKFRVSGPSGMTVEHSKLILMQPHSKLPPPFLGSAPLPQRFSQPSARGRVTALSKANGGIRGIAVGDSSCDKWRAQRHNRSPRKWKKPLRRSNTHCRLELAPSVCTGHDRRSAPHCTG